MARIAGVNIPTNKRVIIALTYIHGIGRKTAVDIADKLGITPRRALNKILDDFFALTAKQAQFGTGKASKPGKE